MKVLHVYSNISQRSGVMGFIMNYYRKISDCVTFDFAYFDERCDSYIDEIASLGGNCYKFSNPKHFFKLRNEVKEFYNQRSSYDIIHIHDPFLISFFGIIKKMKSINGPKIIVHAHSTKYSDHLIGGLRNRLLYLPFKWETDAIFACSEKAGLSLFGKDYQKNGCVISNAIDLTVFKRNDEYRKEIRDEFGLKNQFVIGHVGNFIRTKNHVFIINVFLECLNILPNSVLVLVGTGTYRQKIEMLCKEKNISDKVVFTGVRKDVHKLMNAFDVFFFPSIYEGFGITLIEAQATGLPCVYSSSIPLVTNVIKEQNTILNLSDDKIAWARSILTSKRNDNFDYAESITKAGFNIDVEAKKLIEKYSMVRNK